MSCQRLGALLPSRHWHSVPRRSLLYAVASVQDEMLAHEFVIASVRPSGRDTFERKFKRLFGSNDSKHDWVTSRLSFITLYTAKAFMKECLEPLNDNAFTRVVMDALSPYFEPGMAICGLSDCQWLCAYAVYCACCGC